MHEFRVPGDQFEGSLSRMADADKLNLIQSSENTGWYRSVRPTLGAKTCAPKKTTPKFLVLYPKGASTEE
jgi:hypothetical protein